MWELIYRTDRFISKKSKLSSIWCYWYEHTQFIEQMHAHKIGEFAFGESFGFLDREEDYMNLISAVDSRGEVLNALGHLPRIFRYLVLHLSQDSFWTRGKRGAQALAVLGVKSYFKRRDQRNESRNDILYFLLKAKDPDTGAPLTEKEIIAESISFIVGGSDTTSTTMTNFVDIVYRRNLTMHIPAKCPRTGLRPSRRSRSYLFSMQCCKKQCALDLQVQLGWNVWRRMAVPQSPANLFPRVYVLTFTCLHFDHLISG